MISKMLQWHSIIETRWIWITLIQGTQPHCCSDTLWVGRRHGVCVVNIDDSYFLSNYLSIPSWPITIKNLSQIDKQFAKMNNSLSIYTHQYLLLL